MRGKDCRRRRWGEEAGSAVVLLCYCAVCARQTSSGMEAVYSTREAYVRITSVEADLYEGSHTFYAKRLAIRTCTLVMTIQRILASGTPAHA